MYITFMKVDNSKFSYHLYLFHANKTEHWGKIHVLKILSSWNMPIEKIMLEGDLIEYFHLRVAVRTFKSNNMLTNNYIKFYKSMSLF